VLAFDEAVIEAAFRDAAGEFAERARHGLAVALAARDAIAPQLG